MTNNEQTATANWC